MAPGSRCSLQVRDNLLPRQPIKPCSFTRNHIVLHYGFPNLIICYNNGKQYSIFLSQVLCPIPPPHAILGFLSIASRHSHCKCQKAGPWNQTHPTQYTCGLTVPGIGCPFYGCQGDTYQSFLRKFTNQIIPTHILFVVARWLVCASRNISVPCSSDKSGRLIVMQSYFRELSIVIGFRTGKPSSAVQLPHLK